MDVGSVEVSSEEGCAAGWVPVHDDRSGRSIRHVPGAGSLGAKAARYVKRCATPGPYGWELRALQQMPDGHVPCMLGHRRNPPAVPCRGDASPSSVLVDPGQLWAWLLDCEFYAPETTGCMILRPHA